ncbi:hypothetical protein DPSP01_000726 [Paraphaeosphaeria sporulosa]
MFSSLVRSADHTAPPQSIDIPRAWADAFLLCARRSIEKHVVDVHKAHPRPHNSSRGEYLRKHYKSLLYDAVADEARTQRRKGLSSALHRHSVLASSAHSCSGSGPEKAACTQATWKVPSAKESLYGAVFFLRIR